VRDQPARGGDAALNDDGSTRGPPRNCSILSYKRSITYWIINIYIGM
jgi:hypothetical protein